MQDNIIRKLFLAFIEVLVLHYSSKEPVYGSWIINELDHIGYEVSPGTLYPILHSMERNGLLSCEKRLVKSKIRKYYSATYTGLATLKKSKREISELSRAIQ